MKETVIAIIGFKGGVGKTTSTFNIGAALAKQGFKVLLIDSDPQSNLTTSFGIGKKTTETIGQWLLGELEFKDVVSNQNILDVVPSSLYLTTQEKLIASEAGSEQFLRAELKKVKKKYDFIIIDCPPNLGTMTANALCAADYYLVPFEAEYYSWEGLQPLLDFVNKIRARVNENLQLGGVFLTQYNDNTRTKVNKDIADKLRYDSTSPVKPDQVFKTVIRKNTSLVEAPMLKQNIFDYAPRSNGAIDYMNLTKELISRL